MTRETLSGVNSGLSGGGGSIGVGGGIGGIPGANHHSHLLLRGADSGISLHSSLYRDPGAACASGGGQVGGIGSSSSSSGHMTGSGAVSRGSATPQTTASSVGQMTPVANDDASTGEFTTATRSVSAASNKVTWQQMLLR